MAEVGRPRKEIMPVNINPRTYAYLRVSTADQDLEKNKYDILTLANAKALPTPIEFIEEKVSGKTPWRERKIGIEIICVLNAGDNLVVSELSRLGRSMLEVAELLSILKSNKINVYAVKGDWSLNGGVQSEIIGLVYSMLAEIERDLISERTKEGLRARVALGVKLGRPKGPGKSKLDPFQEEIVGLLRNGSRQCYVAKRYGVTPPTLIHYLQRHNLDVTPRYPERRT